MAPLFAWPWQSWGSSKNYLYGVFLAKAMYGRYRPDESTVVMDTWCLHIFILCMMRLLMYQLWTSYSNMLFLSRHRRIVKKGVDFEQIDNEWDWDNFIILQALVAGGIVYILPCNETLVHLLPVWNKWGFTAAVLLHVAISEPLFYFIHKCFHGKFLFQHYHYLHHSTPVPQAFTAGHGSFLEHLLLTVVVGVPIVGSFLLGHGSLALIYAYVLGFDLLRCFGHCNIEIVPSRIFEMVPFVKYLLYTPTYHSLHNSEMDTNYCLFMPIFDALGNTLNKKSWEEQKKNSQASGKDERAPDFVFLAHIVDFSSAMHAPFLNRHVAALPYYTRIYLMQFLPLSLATMLLMWAKAKAFLVSSYNLRNRIHQTWAVPRYGFQYFLPFAAEGINNQIEDAILKADRMGVKVISLAALNKNEALNGGGTLFVNKHPNLKVRVVHGNTLTAAVILNEIPQDVSEVFLTGATSKLGRAIALYLCKKGVRVLMLTLSAERFRKIQKEAPVESQKNLVQVTKYQAAQHCKTWIVGKWITPRQQSFAPPGAHFHQFVVPPILHFRRDCTYGDLAAMRLPDDVEGLGSCEYTMDRGVVHACHAGGVVHSLEGWTHHEVGALDVERIDLVWEAALKHGLKPATDPHHIMEKSS